MGRDGAAGDQAASTDGDHDGVKIGHQFQQFQCGGALARNGPRMIVGRDDGGACFIRDPLCDGFAIPGGTIVGDDFRAMGASGREL